MRSLILQPGEEVVTAFRQSYAVLVPIVALVLVAVVLPVWYVTRYELFVTVGLWLVLWMVAVALWLTRKVLLWKREKYIITTIRFVKTAHQSLFKQTVTETSLDRILNVSFRTTGPWSVFSGFGDVDLQVVGLLEPIVIRSVRRPSLVKEFLWRLHEKALEGRGTRHSMRDEYAKPNQPLA